MKIKLLYILVSSPEDVYLEQAYVSATSARRRNPQAYLTLLTDTATEATLGSRGPQDEAFRALFDEVVVAPLDPSLPAMKRSRLLKTGMREYVKGDFLFIDPLGHDAIGPIDDVVVLLRLHGLLDRAGRAVAGLRVAVRHLPPAGHGECQHREAARRQG